MEKSASNLAYFHMILPSRLEVEINRREEGGFWAQIKNLPGCYTQGDNFLDLIDMVNDAVFGYFDVPAELASKLGYYVPEKMKELIEKQKQEPQDKARHQQIEELVSKIINNQKVLEFNKN